LGGLKDGVVEVIVRPIAIEDAVRQEPRPGRAGKGRKDRYLNQVHFQVVERLERVPEYVGAVAVKTENDPRFHGDAVTMQKLNRFPVLFDAMARLAHRAQVIPGKCLQSGKDSYAAGLGHHPHQVRIVGDRQCRLGDPVLAQRAEGRKHPLGVVAIGRQVVVDEDEQSSRQVLDLGDHFFDRPLALGTVVKCGDRAEIAAVRASARRLHGADSGIPSRRQQVAGRTLEAHQRRLLIAVDTSESAIGSVRGDLAPNAFRLADHNRVGVPDRFLRTERWMHAAKHHGNAPPAEAAGNLVGPRRRRRHAANADQIHVRVPRDFVDLLVHNANFGVRWAFGSDRQKAEQ
jgi:hypothetical protein